jgi:hypothetical protein
MRGGNTHLGRRWTIVWRTISALILLAVVINTPAPPPLVTGDVPTADKRFFEWYAGVRYQESESGSVSRQLPFTELVYGISDRQEITFEIPYLSERGEHGFGDGVIGTKFMFLKERERLPGFALSFELKLPTGDESRGLGSGEFDYDLRLRAQKTWSWLTLIGNAGYTFISEPKIGGIASSRENVWIVTCAQEYELHDKFRLLSEIYWLNSEEPGEPNRLAANVGFKYRLLESLTTHASVGRSLREGNRGGPDFRAYAGLKWTFGPFPKPIEEK